MSPFQNMETRVHSASFGSGRLLAGLIGSVLCAGMAQAADLGVVSSGGFAEAFRALSERYEAQVPTEHVRREFGPSMGATPGAVPARLARGEALDVVIMVESSLDELMVQGRLLPGSKVRLALSKIACAVPAGAPRPALATEQDVRQAFAAADSIAWSDSASGSYIQNELLDHLGVAQQVKAKGRQIPATPVGEILARHEAAFGCQQRSELQPVRGIDIVGDLPDSLQRTTPYAAAVVATSTRVRQAHAFIAFMAGPASRAVIAGTGLEPVAP
ncbi:substrate-binding domain-containing protein [Roseateles saccharophilus]|nr:substrate-binding domain-containing protein [Roseateles saccharophilus]